MTRTVAKLKPLVSGAGLALVLAAFLVPVPRAAASAPSCRYTIDAGQDTVRDNVTGLTWARTQAPGAYARAGADAQCMALGAGWRVPSLEELLTIVDLSVENPAVDKTAFADQAPANYMTSTDFGDDPAKTWWVNFVTGETQALAKTEYCSLRCVK